MIAKFKLCAKVRHLKFKIAFIILCCAFLLSLLSNLLWLQNSRLHLKGWPTSYWTKSRKIASLGRITTATVPQFSASIIDSEMKLRTPASPGVPVFFDTNDTLLIPMMREKQFRVQYGLGLHHDIPHTDFEQEILSTQPLQDFRDAPDELESKVYVISDHKQYKTGDRIQFRVDVYDGFGKQRKAGGDEIRMKLKSSTGASSVAAHIEDLHNGSYLGTTFLQWEGATTIAVCVTYPREYVREVVYLRMTLHFTAWIQGVFLNSKSNRENTVCLPIHPIPGYASVCNFTASNGDLPFFCASPTEEGLNCSHLKNFEFLEAIHSLPHSKPYEQLTKKIDGKPYFRLIPNNISIIAQPGRNTSQDLPPCSVLLPEVTWESQAPLGWMDHGTWRPLTCSIPPHFTAAHVQQCLRNTTLYFLGDSNMRVWWFEVKKYLNCSKLISGTLFNVCEVSSQNTTLKSVFHARPTSTSWRVNVPLPVALRELHHHRHRQVILILHYYAHFIAYSISVYSDRIRAARKYIGEFLQVNPEAKVFIRGPHVMLRASYEKATFGDIFGPAYIRILKEEFRGLRDKVWFLDFWDMTIATDNMSTHPPNETIQEMVKLLLGYIC